MSDEQTPPPPALRLKPRLKPSEGETSAATPVVPTEPAAPPAAAVVPAPTDAAVTAESASKIRLKPRLAPASPEPTAVVAPLPEPAPIAPAPDATAAVVAPVAPEISAAASTEAPAAGGPPRIRLKPRVADPAAAAEGAAPAALAPAASPLPPTPEPVAAPLPSPSAAPAAPEAVPAPAAEPGKFKFKPKAPSAPPPAASAPPPPPTSVPAATSLPPPPGVAPKSKPPFPPPPGVAPKAMPPFPVVAPPKPGKTTPPIPHLDAKEELAIPEENVPAKKIPLWKQGYFKYAVVAVLIIVGWGVWFAINTFGSAARGALHDKMTLKPGAAPAASSATAPKAAAPSPALANKPAQPTPGLSETQNAIAHAPVNAVNKAKDVIGKRQGSDQGREAVGAITDGDKPAVPADKSASRPAAAPTVATSSLIAPGVSATNDDVSAATEASPAFRSFVANAKITGVFQGEPPRVMLNGRLARAGDIVEPTLVITFADIDPDKKLILFKDKSGAVVTRRY